MRKVIAVIVLLALVIVTGFAQGAPPNKNAQQQTTPPISKAIKVTSPIGGSLAKLQSCPITWTSQGLIGSTVNIVLMQGANTIKLLTNSPISPGTFTWTISKDIPTGANYSIVVQSVHTPSVKGQSNTFSIGVATISGAVDHGPVSVFVPEQVKITKPVQGGNWAAGDPQDITWEYSGDPPGQASVLLMKGSQVVKTVSAAQSWGQWGKGHIMPYYMPTDVLAGDGYFIKVESTTNTKYRGTGGQFNIQSYQSLVVTQPPNNAPTANWGVGSVHSINWTYTSSCGSHVQVKLHGGVNDQWKIYPLVTSWSIGSNGSGNFTWTVPSEGTGGIHWIPGNVYQLTVSGVEQQKCWDWTGKFTVSP